MSHKKAYKSEISNFFMTSVACFAFGVSCTQPVKNSELKTVTFVLKDSIGPVSGAKIILNGKEAGRSGEDGVFRKQVLLTEGSFLNVLTVCDDFEPLRLNDQRVLNEAWLLRENTDSPPLVNISLHRINPADFILPQNLSFTEDALALNEPTIEENLTPSVPELLSVQKVDYKVVPSVEKAIPKATNLLVDSNSFSPKTVFSNVIYPNFVLPVASVSDSETSVPLKGSELVVTNLGPGPFVDVEVRLGDKVVPGADVFFGKTNLKGMWPAGKTSEKGQVKANSNPALRPDVVIVSHPCCIPAVFPFAVGSGASRFTVNLTEGRTPRFLAVTSSYGLLRGLENIELRGKDNTKLALSSTMGVLVPPGKPRTQKQQIVDTSFSAGATHVLPSAINDLKSTDTGLFQKVHFRTTKPLVPRIGFVQPSGEIEKSPYFSRVRRDFQGRFLQADQFTGIVSGEVTRWAKALGLTPDELMKNGWEKTPLTLELDALFELIAPPNSGDSWTAKIVDRSGVEIYRKSWTPGQGSPEQDSISLFKEFTEKFPFEGSILEFKKENEKIVSAKVNYGKKHFVKTGQMFEVLDPFTAKPFKEPIVLQAGEVDENFTWMRIVSKGSDTDKKVEILERVLSNAIVRRTSEGTSVKGTVAVPIPPLSEKMLKALRQRVERTRQWTQQDFKISEKSSTEVRQFSEEINKILTKLPVDSPEYAEFKTDLRYFECLVFAVRVLIFEENDLRVQATKTLDEMLQTGTLASTLPPSKYRDSLIVLSEGLKKSLGNALGGRIAQKQQ